MKVILTGPESTGKSALARQLAEDYQGVFIPEYARDYVGALQRSYTRDDVMHIAQKQKEQMDQWSAKPERSVFFDTYLIITKVWMEVCYGEYPKWIDEAIQETTDALYLLCNPDIPWTPDPLRENGGERRKQLFMRYEEELNKVNLQYKLIEGQGQSRFDCACKHIKTWQERQL